jgi:hypothetical protein
MSHQADHCNRLGDIRFNRTSSPPQPLVTTSLCHADRAAVNPPPESDLWTRRFKATAFLAGFATVERPVAGQPRTVVDRVGGATTVE